MSTGPPNNKIKLLHTYLQATPPQSVTDESSVTTYVHILMTIFIRRVPYYRTHLKVILWRSILRTLGDLKDISKVCAYVSIAD